MKKQLLPHVTGIPFGSIGYPTDQSTPKRLSLEYSSQCHQLASRGSQKLKNNKLDRMSKIAETLTQKLSLGAKILKVGGLDGRVAFCSEKSIELSSPTGEFIRIPYKVSIPIEMISRANESQNLKTPTRKYIAISTRDNFEFWFMGFANCRRTLKYLQQVATLARVFNNIGNLGHGGGYVSEVGSIIDDCVSLMNVGVGFSFLFIPRSFNCSAHLFAQEGIGLEGSWTGRPPDWAESCILTDRALISPSSLS